MSKDNAEKQPMNVNGAVEKGKKLKCKKCGNEDTSFINIDTKDTKKRCCPVCYKKAINDIGEVE